MGSSRSIYTNMTGRSEKYIGIDKWVPFSVLDAGMVALLDCGKVDREQLKLHLHEFIKGENRVSKAAKVAYNILTQPVDILSAAQKEFTRESYIRLPENERKVLMVSLFACAYPMFYDLMVAMATAFKVQPEVNKKFISQKMSNIYGSNRSFDMALDSLLIMIIDLDIVKRVKRSIYTLGATKTVRTPLISESYIYTDIKLSGSKTVLVEDLQSRPWYLFSRVEYQAQNHNRLLRLAEGKLVEEDLSIR